MPLSQPCADSILIASFTVLDMAISDLDLFNAWNHVLKLCRLKSGEVVTILTKADTHEQSLRTATMAVQRVGAKLNRLDFPGPEWREVPEPRSLRLSRRDAAGR